jgi:hypothetical protein
MVEKGGIEAGGSPRAAEDIGRRRASAALPQEHRHLDVWFDSGTDALPRCCAAPAGAGARTGASRGRPLPRRPRPAPRLVPLVAAHRLRHGRPRALPGLLTHGFTSTAGPQDEQVARQRHRAAEVSQEARRRDHPPVGRGDRLLGRPRHRRQDPEARGRSYRRIRNTLRFLLANTSDFDPRRTRCRSPRCWRSTATRWPRARRCRSAMRAVPRRGLRALRVPPGRGQAADVLLRRPGRLLPRHPEGPPLHHGAEVAGAPLGADRALAHHARDAALDGAVPQLHRRGSVEGLVELAEGHATQIEVNPSHAVKCERCWHYREDVGANPVYQTICGRCVLNLHGSGEARAHA